MCRQSREIRVPVFEERGAPSAKTGQQRRRPLHGWCVGP